VLDLLLRGARTGVLTTRYPAVAEPAPPAFRGQVTLSPERCTGDGACVRVCPSAAIRVEATAAGGWTWELNDARCVFCGLCAEVCPAAALALSTEFELAVRDAADLVTRVTFVPAAPTGENGRGA
jgi:formate hydrogenlyase subunit 6